MMRVDLALLSDLTSVPDPSTGQPLQAVVVNADATGYELAAVAGGLPTPDRGVAFLGGFGLDISDSVVVDHSQARAVPFDEAYTIEEGATSPIDNAYMSWNDLDGSFITVKQGGWYCVGVEVTWSVPLTATVPWSIGTGTSAQIGPTGSGLQGAMCAGQQELDDSLLCWIQPNQIIDLVVDTTALDADPTLQYALLTFTPLFPLAT